jgi:cobyrinic acid a,c-diamide synthase
MNIPNGLIIAAPASGTGKTMLTLGLLAALRARGIVVQPFKSGPDYIDPAFHTAAAGRVSINLDTWAMGKDQLLGLTHAATGADLIITEGSMGLFDGVAKAGASGTGASADLAILMGWPVVLVLDVGGQAQSAAAVALGFAAMRPELRLAGAVLNKIASPRHEALVRDGMAQAGITVFGALPRNPAITLPERHLGLVQAQELPELTEILTRAGRFITDHIDLDALIAASAGARKPTKLQTIAPPAQRIALAQDAAFSFVYPHLLDGWRRAGAEILPFSPLADQSPDPSADMCWLPGGYPELHAGGLAGKQNFRSGTRAFALSKPVHGECGGYMAMGAGLVDKSGQRHEMLGLLRLETSFQVRKMHLGYRRAILVEPLPNMTAGSTLNGHEFHYATITNQPDAPLAHVTDANGTTVAETGSIRLQPEGGRSTGTFFHLIAEVS